MLDWLSSLLRTLKNLPQPPGVPLGILLPVVGLKHGCSAEVAEDELIFPRKRAVLFLCENKDPHGSPQVQDCPTLLLFCSPRASLGQPAPRMPPVEERTPDCFRLLLYPAPGLPQPAKEDEPALRHYR